MKNRKQNANLHVYRPVQPKYPNAADDRYFAAKALNMLAAIVSSMGLAGLMVFLVILA